MRQLPASPPDIPQYEVNLKMLNMMFHDDRGQRCIIILAIFKAIFVSRGDNLGKKGGGSFKFEMFVDKTRIIYESFQFWDADIAISSYINIKAEGSNLK